MKFKEFAFLLEYFYNNWIIQIIRLSQPVG